MAKSELLSLKITFNEISLNPQYMRNVMRDWIAIVGPLAKKLKGYPTGDPTEPGGAKLAAFYRFPDLKPEDETFFNAFFRPNMNDLSQNYLVA